MSAFEPGIARPARLRATLHDARLESRTTREMAPADKRLVPDPAPYPIRLAHVIDLPDFARQLHSAGAKVGNRAGRGGDPTRHIALEFSRPKVSRGRSRRSACTALQALPRARRGTRQREAGYLVGRTAGGTILARTHRPIRSRRGPCSCNVSSNSLHANESLALHRMASGDHQHTQLRMKFDLGTPQCGMSNGSRSARTSLASR